MGESYESFYQGGESSLNPAYGSFVGYRVDASGIGFPGSAQTANQLGEAANAIKTGTKSFEVSAVMPDTADQIPKQHFKEIRALMKLSGVKPSVHGPIIDPSGFGEKGWQGETARQDAERRIWSTLERAKDVDTDGNMPFVLHASNGAPGAEFRPAEGSEAGDENRWEMFQNAAINRESGQIAPLKKEEKFYPLYSDEIKKTDKGVWKGTTFDVERNLDSLNETEWENKLTDLAQFNKHSEEVIGNAPKFLGEYSNAVIDPDSKKIFSVENGRRKLISDMTDAQRGYYDKMRKADIFLDNVRMNFSGAFNKAFEYGTEEQREKLKELADEYSKKMRGLELALPGEDGKPKRAPLVWGPVKKQKVLNEAVEKLAEITSGNNAPKIYQLASDFALENSSKTFGNVAYKAYKEFGEKAPVLAIENVFQGQAGASAEDLKKTVEKTRDVFVENLVKKEGKKKKEAEKIADKLIGATWDVGHLNVFKKAGFSDKDLAKETEKIAPLVKHVHLTDNFGYSDSHLIPGMGNAPIKEHLEMLEKKGKLKEMRKIFEVPGFIQHFKKLPHSMILGAMGSPIYGAKMASYWNESLEAQGNYFGGYGTINPGVHHSMYGAGFTSLPSELGGNIPGMQSRFSGAPNA